MNVHRRTVCALAVGLVIAAGSGCLTSDLDEAPQGSAGAADPSGEFSSGAAGSIQASARATDVAAFAERAQHSFFADRAGFRAIAGDHAVAVDRDRIELTPYQPTEDSAIAGGPLVLDDERIAVGGVAVPTEVDHVDVGPAGELRRARGGLVEELANLETGVEQSWRFATRPDGDGDLEISLAVTGQTLAAATATGLHFVADDGMGFVYRHGLWIDAAGRERRVPAEYRDGRIVLTVPAEVLAASAYPAVLDPSIENEIAIDTAVAASPTGSFSRAPAVAFSGAQFLVVWRDDRNGVDSDIYATRMTTAGAVTDTTGIAVNKAAGVQDNPTVAFVGGTKYLVVWENYKSPAADPDLVAATVTTGGVVAALGNVVATAAVESAPHLAARGTGALLVYQSGADVRAAVWNGSSFGGSTTITTGASEPSAAANPTGNYLVAFTSGTTGANLGGQLVTSAGALSGTAITISAGAGTQAQSAVAWDGSQYVVAWFNASTDVYGTRVTTAGAIRDTHLEGAVAVGGVALASATDTQNHPDLACLTASCVVTWQDRRNNATTYLDLYARSINTSTMALGTEGVISAAAHGQVLPRLTTAGTTYLEAWQDGRTGGADSVMAARVDATGAVNVADAAGILVARGSNLEARPTMGRSSGGWLVAWTDSRVQGNNIMAVRGKNNGNLLDNTALSICNATGQQQVPVATFDGTNYVVAWSDARGADYDVYLGRLPTSGGTLPDGATGLAVSTAAKDQLVSGIASNGATSLVVWQDRRGTNFDVWGSIFNSTTGVVGANFAISTAAGDQVVPSVVYDPTGGVFVVAWNDGRASGNVDIWAARVSTAGVVLDPNGVQLTGAAGGQFNPKLAVGAGKVMAVWDDRRNDGGDIYGTRLTTSGNALTVLDAAGIAIAQVAGSKQVEPTVAFVGNTASNSNHREAFAIMWSDERNLATTGADIYGNSVKPADGARFSTTGGYAVSSGAGDESRPVLSGRVAQGNSNIEAEMTYQRFVAASANQRVMVRLVTYDDLPQ